MVRKLVTTAAALAALAGLVTACSTDSTTGGNATATSTTQSKTVTMDLLKSMIPAQQPDGTKVERLITVKEAMAEGVMDSPKGMVFKPEVCLTYLEDVIGPLDKLEGWLQYGTRRTTLMSNLFSTMVVKLPEAVSVEKIKASALRCAHGGEMVLADKAIGELTYTERKPPALANANSFAMNQGVAFPATDDPAVKSTIEQFGFAAGDQCLTDSAYLEMNGVLIWSLEPEASFTDQKLTQMHETVARVMG